MPKINCLFISLVISLSGFGQKNADSLYFARMPLQNINIDEKVIDHPHSIPFSQIDVIDARFDTSCVGFYSSDFLSSCRKLFFKTSSSDQVRNYLTKNYVLQNANDSSLKLLIIIEKLWMIGGSRDSTNNIKSGFDNTVGYNVFVKAKLMAQKNNNYYALYEVDSALGFTQELEGQEHRFIQRALDVLMANISDKKAVEIQMHHKAFALTDIKSYMNEKREMPILQDAVCKRGVYKTFDEFKQDNPSITDFEIGKHSKTDALYLKDEKGNEYIFRDFWGFCDGKKLFINKADNFFELYKHGSSFYMYGFTSFIKGKAIGNQILGVALFGLVGAAAAPTEVKYSSEKVLLQLDMETGELY
jgi:hypothetical protein